MGSILDEGPDGGAAGGGGDRGWRRHRGCGGQGTDFTTAMAEGVRQPDGTTRPEPRMAVDDVGRAVAYMAGLPLEANVATLTVMASGMPYVGRG